MGESGCGWIGAVESDDCLFRKFTFLVSIEMDIE